MRCTFNLKEPNKKGLTSIRLIAYFKNEDRKLIYSTGERINPIDWDFENKRPFNMNGRSKKSSEMRALNAHIERYSNYFYEIVNRFKLSNREIKISSIKQELDIKFKRTSSRSNKLFEVYDKFIQSKNLDRTDRANSVSTINRYKYFKTLLLEFQRYTGKQISFPNINLEFYNSFIAFCEDVKDHSVNTLSRNLGLFKTFLNWSVTNGYTYNLEFKRFKNIRREQTDEIALTLKEIEMLYEYDFTENKRLEKIRDLFVFGCATGLRFSNYSKVKRTDIYGGHINVRDEKNKDKVLSIPLNDFSKEILEKYDYFLPRVSNQKFNKAIKEVFLLAGFCDSTKKTSKVGKELKEEIIPKYKRISSHTARRSFITIMKNEKIPDRVIMSYTGHKSLETFNKYYRPNTDDKIHFMKSVWKRGNHSDELKVVR